MPSDSTAARGRPDFDSEISDIANYVLTSRVDSTEAVNTARLCLMDSIGCAILALSFPACRRMLGPVASDAARSPGARVPGTPYELDPVAAAFNIGAAIRWLDFNDTWLAAEWGHPSDNLGAILAASDWLSRRRFRPRPMTVGDVLIAMIKAHEIQGVMALENSFNQRGLDHVILVKLASCAVTAGMMGCSETQVANAVSQVWCDLGPLRVYRHAPNTGSRKSWAAGDATSRGLFLALLSERGEMGYPSALTAPTWGFYDRVWGGERFRFQRPYGSYVMENVLFKVAYPAEFHAQTAVEAAIRLHPQVFTRLDEIDRVDIATHEAAVRIIDKKGTLHNPADRDHCLQYMTAVALIFGDLTAEDYEADRACDPRIDALRDRMQVAEDPGYTRDYHDPEKRSIANRVQVFFRDGASTESVAVEYPIGHRRRRAEAIPLLERKFTENVRTGFASAFAEEMLALFRDEARLGNMPFGQFMGRLRKTDASS